jgi:hypothetical protein
LFVVFVVEGVDVDCGDCSVVFVVGVDESPLFCLLISHGFGGDAVAIYITLYKKDRSIFDRIIII